MVLKLTLSENLRYRSIARAMAAAAIFGTIAATSVIAAVEGDDGAVAAQVVDQIEMMKSQEPGLSVTPMASPDLDLTASKDAGQATQRRLPTLPSAAVDDGIEPLLASLRVDEPEVIGPLFAPEMRPERNFAPRVASTPKKRSMSQFKCLAEAVYFEARSEQLLGQRAVAEVILNRVSSRYFPNSICSVVNQGAHKRNRCQFSYNCDGRPERISEPRAYQRAVAVAKAAILGAGIKLTDGATHYHTTYVRPKWSFKLTRTTQIGTHIFYRDPTRTAQR